MNTNYENLYEEIFQRIKENDKIIIHRHERPDPDAYGSQGAMYQIIKENFPEKTLITVGKDSPSLDFLFKNSEVTEEDYTILEKYTYALFKKGSEIAREKAFSF